MDSNFWRVPTMIIPKYYRETPFILPSGTTVWVAGLAKPNYGGQDPSLAMAYLKEQGIQTVFGLEASPIFQKIAKTVGIDYFDVSIPDFTAPNLALYDRVYDEILWQAEAGKKVAIHCYGGMGRTGTVLAAIKLRELAMSETFYDHQHTENKVYCYPAQSCTENVRDAVLAIRKIPESDHAIEDPAQIESLCEYERLLRSRKEIKHDVIDFSDFDSKITW